MLRLVFSLIFAGLVGIIVLLGVINAEAYLLQYSIRVLPIRDTISNPEWVGQFKVAARNGVLIALALTLAWYVFGQFFHRTKTWNLTRTRWVWVALLVALGFGLTILGFRVVPPSQGSGNLIGHIFFVINGIIVYYVSTVFFSPSTVKYAPLGSLRLAVPGNQLMGVLLK